MIRYVKFIKSESRLWKIDKIYLRVRLRIYSDPYFPAFGLNAERYFVFGPNAGKYGPEWLWIGTLFMKCWLAIIIVLVMNQCFTLNKLPILLLFQDEDENCFLQGMVRRGESFHHTLSTTNYDIFHYVMWKLCRLLH